MLRRTSGPEKLSLCMSDSRVWVSSKACRRPMERVRFRISSDARGFSAMRAARAWARGRTSARGRMALKPLRPSNPDPFYSSPEKSSSAARAGETTWVRRRVMPIPGVKPMFMKVAP